MPHRPLTALISAAALPCLAATPGETYQKMAEHFAAGAPGAAIAMMDEASQKEFVTGALDGIASAVLDGEELPSATFPHGGEEVAATLGEIGLEGYKFPEWVKKGTRPSEQQMATYEDGLFSLLSAAPDRGRFLGALTALSNAVGFDEFSGKITGRPEGIGEGFPDTVWVEFSDADGKETIPFRFAKSGDGWSFRGLDYDAFDEMLYRFVERKNISIAGEDAGGEPVALSDYGGKIVLIDFWGTW